MKSFPEPDKDTPSIERCCWLMMNLYDMDTAPEPEVVGEYGEIVEAAKIAGFDKNKKRQYKMGMDRERLQEAILRERVAEGRAEGLAEGMEKGRVESSRENALRMLELGMEISVISQVTGLRDEDIRGLAAENNK